MPNLKKTTVALIVILVFLSQTGISFAQFQGVEGHWAQEQILKWLDKGWVELSEDGRFYPDAKITREEFIVLANKAFGFEDETRVEKVAMEVAAENVSGAGNSNFSADEYIGRIEVIAIITRIANLPLPESSTILNQFKDNEEISEWGKAYVAAAVNIGIVNGYPDGSFRPYEHVSKAEAITVLNRVIEKVTKPGVLVGEPGLVDSGSTNRIVLFYALGDDFNNGSVTFYLPPEIKAIEGKDAVVISGIAKETEIYQLESRHIRNDGKEVVVSDITAAEKSVIMLLLEDKTMPNPGYYTFSISADADGPGAKLPTADDYYESIDFFASMPAGYEGILEVSPQSAKSGSNQTIMLTYTLGKDFKEGCIDLNLPKELAFTVGQDKVTINGVEKTLTEEDISDDGQRVHVTGITAKKGDKLSMTLYNKTIPAAGSYLFCVEADIDGEKGKEPKTLGSGREFVAFLAYTETVDNYQIFESFIKAINEGDNESAIGLLADNVVFVDNYMDGFVYWDFGKGYAKEIIDNYILYDSHFENDNSTLKRLSENVWQVEGISWDYSDVVMTGIYPEENYKGFRYTSKYFVIDDKICYVEFLWNHEDELTWYKLTDGHIGISGYPNEKNEVIIRGCVPGLPAEKAGLKPGDVIVAIDGISIQDMKHGYDEARLRLTGKEGTKVKLTINRNGQVFDIEVERTEDW